MNSDYTKDLWENQILPYWSHRDRPAGQRFLGSIRLQRQDSDRLLNIVGQNLQQLDITYATLNDEFYSCEQQELKILTFALSEYAYYYSSERFWQGFCNRLDIDYNQRVEFNLRRAVDKGIDLLGLVRAKGGYKYVSTLWLQSGVPEQNLTHFAQLVQEIADEYGWWELTHTPAEDLSQVLLSVCEEKHHQWGTLINFLRSSYCEDKETEPISGQLLQGIAIVAQELQRQKASPQILQDEARREEILGNYYLPQNFFLRNWNAVIQVLTPKTGSNNRRQILTRRSKPLYMSLDVADTGNTQLILPKQALWKPAWRSLRGTYCQIPQANWEDTIPTTGDLIIPELIINIDRTSENWYLQLLDHNHQHLEEWRYSGIDSHLPCLVFNSLTGEHLPLRLPNPTINGVEEIICFTPKDIQLQFSHGIEILDNYIPSSIRGWKGRLIRLTIPESSIVLSRSQAEPEISRSQAEPEISRSQAQPERSCSQAQPGNYKIEVQPQFSPPVPIAWKLVIAQPILTGLRLKGKKPIYLEPPIFWYPPINNTININILIEDLQQKNIIVRTIETRSPLRRWFAISLAQWLIKPGSYEARFWLEDNFWSYQFEVKSNQIAVVTKPNKVQIRSHSFFQANLPIKYNNSTNFWAEIISIKGLWSLEEIIFYLLSSTERVSYQSQADASGELEIRLSFLYDLLPESDWYALDYLRLGLEPQRLLEMASPQNLIWNWGDRAINLSGLLPNKLYSLSCWNLLLPDREPVEIKIPLSDDATTTIPLNLPTGIYHIQLLSPQRLPENLGWWCDSNRYDLPEAINGDEARENYCYTILGNNESAEALLGAVTELNLYFHIQQVQNGIDSLEKNKYHLKKWLNPSSLLGKLKVILEDLRKSSMSDKNNSVEMPNQENINAKSDLAVAGSWYLVRVMSKRRNLFLKYLEMSISKNKLQELILETKIPAAAIYEDIVLLNLSNRKEASTYLQNIEYFQRIEPKPLKPEDVNRMLVAK